MPDTRHEFVSVREAAIRFGTSESDIRRRIKRGELVAESVARPGGTMLRVRFDAPDPSQPTSEPRQPAPDTSQDVSAAIEAAAAPLVARLAAQDAVLGRQSERIAELERENGRLQADATHASGRASELQAERDAARRELEALRARSWWRRLVGS